MTQAENATEFLICPRCGKQIHASVTIGKADAVTLACPQCKERFSLGEWRPSPPPEVAPVQRPDGEFEQFPLYREFYGKQGGRQTSLQSDSVWGMIAAAVGFLFFLGGVVILFGSADQNSSGNALIAELRAIRGVLLLILGVQIITWGNKQWAAASLAKRNSPPVT